MPIEARKLLNGNEEGFSREGRQNTLYKGLKWNSLYTYIKRAQVELFYIGQQCLYQTPYTNKGKAQYQECGTSHSC